MCASLDAVRLIVYESPDRKLQLYRSRKSLQAILQGITTILQPLDLPRIPLILGISFMSSA